MSQINLKAKQKKMEKWKLYINCKFIGNKPEVKLLKWWRNSISKGKWKERENE